MHIFQGKHSLMETMQNLLFLFTEICIIPIVVVVFFLSKCKCFLCFSKFAICNKLTGVSRLNGKNKWFHMN